LGPTDTRTFHQLGAEVKLDLAQKATDGLRGCTLASASPAEHDALAGDAWCCRSGVRRPSLQVATGLFSAARRVLGGVPVFKLVLQPFLLRIEEPRTGYPITLNAPNVSRQL
jgi:hypothetical protein